MRSLRPDGMENRRGRLIERPRPNRSRSVPRHLVRGVLGLPLIGGCVAWLECRLIPERHTEDAYDTCFGEVVSAQADARVFDEGHWSFRDDNTELHTLHHLGGGHFAWPARMVQARVLPAG